MYFKRLFTPGLSIHSYLLGDEKSKRCVAIDPTRHVVSMIMHAQNAELEITDIVETHVHADYVSGAKELKHQLNEKPLIYCSGMGGAEWIPRYADVVVKKGTSIEFGNLRLEAVHTPGHTPEHVIWVCYDTSRSATTPWFAFTGDSLFVGSIGRPDLLGSQELAILGPQLYHTVFDVLATFPDFLEIFPAHGEGSLCGKALQSRAASTIGYEKLFNPYFKKMPEKDWLEHVLEGLTPPPPYFKRLKKMNVEGASLLNTLQTKEIMGNDSTLLKNLFLLDVRLPELYAASHFKGSINIPFSHSFTQWVGRMVPADIPIGLVVETPHTSSEVIDQLRLMGFDQPIWIVPFGGVVHADLPLCSFPMIEVEDLAQQLSKKAPIYVLDVRAPDEWKSGHIPGAHHLELIKLEEELGKLPRDQKIALVCRSGQRASLAASILRKCGFSSVANVRGGMQAWKHIDKLLTKDLKS